MKKNYTKESLNMYEKKYLECIVISTKNMYLRKNKEIIDNPYVILNENIKIEEESYFKEIEIKEQRNVKKDAFENLLSNPYLYKLVKALPKEEKEVLFYLFQEQKNISQIATEENKNRRTIRKYRDSALSKIKENFERENSSNEKRNI